MIASGGVASARIRLIKLDFHLTGSLIDSGNGFLNTESADPPTGLVLVQATAAGRLEVTSCGDDDDVIVAIVVPASGAVSAVIIAVATVSNNVLTSPLLKATHRGVTPGNARIASGCDLRFLSNKDGGDIELNKLFSAAVACLSSVCTV